MRYGRELSIAHLALGCAHKPEAPFDGGSQDQDAEGDTRDDSTPSTVCDEPQPAAPECGVVADAGTPVSIVSGSYHTCALLAGGTVKCWGDNTQGQLGTGVGCTEASPVPLPVANLCRVKALAASTFHTCALLDNGTVRCWGADPAGIADFMTRTTLDAGADAACPILENVGPQMFGSSPGAVPCLTGVVAIAAGEGVDCAVLSNGTVRCWGERPGGGLGDGSGLTVVPWPASLVQTPVTVSNIHTATRVAVGYNTGCALLRDATVECWGRNESNELGNGSTTPSAIPVKVTGLSHAVSITANAVASFTAGYSCALLADGTVRCWGDNQDGELGDGETTLSSALIPQVVSNVTGVASLVGGPGHVFAILTDGTLTAWGADGCGELGNGTITDTSEPTRGPALDHVIAVSSGACHACTLLADGGVECWGNNAGGELGDGHSENVNVLVPVQVAW